MSITKTSGLQVGWLRWGVDEVAYPCFEMVRRSIKAVKRKPGVGREVQWRKRREEGGGGAAGGGGETGGRGSERERENEKEDEREETEEEE